MAEHLKKFPPSGMLVPELLAHQIVYFLQANTAKEDRDKLPAPGDYIPWSEKTVSVAEQVKALDKQIAALPADDDRRRNALRLEQAKLLTEEV